MTIKKGVSAIIYDDNGDYYFLILHRCTTWNGWEFCKGGIENGEKEVDALVREVQEETGLSRFRVRKKIDVERTFDNNGVQYEFAVYLVEASMNIPVKLNNAGVEHDNYLWTTKDSVLEKLHWDDEKRVFLEALEEIKNLE